MFKKTEKIRNVFGEESKTQKQKNEIIDSVISKEQIMKKQIIKSDVAVKKATPVLKTKDLDLIDINLEGDKKSTFYNIITTNAGNSIEFKIAKILTFLEDNGFCRLKMPKGGYELIRIERRSIISFADNSDIMKVIKTKVLDEDNQPEVWEAFLERNFMLPQLFTSMCTIDSASLNTATKDMSYFFFSNTIVRVTSHVVETIDYEDYDGLIFKDQIIDHNFQNKNQEVFKKAMFNIFLGNICNNDIARYQQLTTSIGYLCHSFKDKALTKAVILVDEEIDFAGGAEGGTGKTLITDAIGYVAKTVIKDGRSLVAKNNRFFYQDVELSHRIMVIDDISPEVPFDNFFSIVTGGMVVEKKGKQSFTIPFELSPKMIITSNYMVKGNGGNSEERRKIEIEISPYYRGKSIKDDFNCTFFSDWDV